MKHPTVKKINGVFEGGGVKGSALVGAIEVTEDKGYVFENVAGTSAGSLVAAFLASGYKAFEIKKIMDEVDYNKFLDQAALANIPVIGKGLQLFLKEGIYKGDYVEKWLADVLAQKGVRTFGDLIMEKYSRDSTFIYKLQVIASDITNGKLLVFPNDAAEYGINPNDLSVAKALRMSISIPFFYEPVILKKFQLQRDQKSLMQLGQKVKSYIVDGGILSNFPVWLLDDNPNLDCPTLGYKLVDPAEAVPATINGPIDFLKAMFKTMMEAHDARYIKDSDFARTIPIPTL